MERWGEWATRRVGEWAGGVWLRFVKKSVRGRAKKGDFEALEGFLDVRDGFVRLWSFVIGPLSFGKASVGVARMVMGTCGRIGVWACGRVGVWV
jgi:hypothetical protein